MPYSASDRVQTPQQSAQPNQIESSAPLLADERAEAREHLRLQSLMRGGPRISQLRAAQSLMASRQPVVQRANPNPSSGPGIEMAINPNVALNQNEQVRHKTYKVGEDNDAEIMGKIKDVVDQMIVHVRPYLQVLQQRSLDIPVIENTKLGTGTPHTRHWHNWTVDLSEWAKKIQQDKTVNIPQKIKDLVSTMTNVCVDLSFVLVENHSGTDGEEITSLAEHVDGQGNVLSATTYEESSQDDPNSTYIANVYSNVTGGAAKRLLTNVAGQTKKPLKLHAISDDVAKIYEDGFNGKRI